MNELTLRLIEELNECVFSRAEYYQLPDVSNLDENKVVTQDDLQNEIITKNADEK